MSIKGYMIDIQGTLIDDKAKKPIEGAIEIICDLRVSKTPFVLVTNNTKLDSDRFIDYLRGLGFEFDDRQYIDPLMVLQDMVSPCKVAAYGSKEFLAILRARGYELNYDRAEALLVSVKEDYSGEDFSQMVELLLGGARLVGMHETSLYVKNKKRYPGVGAILKMLTFATAKEYSVVGKPSERFYKEALKRLKEQQKDIEFKDTVMISDDLAGDLKGASDLGLKTALVLSGKVSSLDEVGGIMSWGPKWVANDIGEWFRTYKEDVK